MIFSGNNHCEIIMSVISFDNSSVANNILNCNKFNNSIKLCFINFVKETFIELYCEYVGASPS